MGPNGGYCITETGQGRKVIILHETINCTLTMGYKILAVLSQFM